MVVDAITKFQEFSRFLLDAKPNMIENYIENNFTPAFRDNETLEKRIATFMDWKVKGGFELVEVQNKSRNQLFALIRNPISEEYWQLVFEVERRMPFRISDIKIGRAALPILENNLDDDKVATCLLEYAERMSAIELFSGAVLIARNGRVIGRGAFGFANQDFEIPNTIDTRFNIASLGKSWTGVAIAQLVQNGKLAFQSKVTDFIQYPKCEDAKKIEIRHLLSHTSGLGTYFNDNLKKTPRHFIRSVDDYLALDSSQQLAFSPGSKWEYSNTGFVLAGKIIEIVTGMSYFDYIKENIFEPAGMSNSGFFEYDFVNKQLAVGYWKKWSSEGYRTMNCLFENFVVGCPAGGGCSTIDDIFAFTQALNEGVLIDKTMLETITTAKPELNSPYYGYGFSIHPERALYGHSGGMMGVSANVDIFQDPAGWVVVILANDLSMRPLVFKSRQLVGLKVEEADVARAYLPRSGLKSR